MEYDVHQAFRNINNVQLLARTEYFERDLCRFPTILQQYDIEFNLIEMAPQNITSEDLHRPLDDRISKVKGLLANENYEKFLEANAQDIHLLEHVSSLIGNCSDTEF